MNMTMNTNNPVPCTFCRYYPVRSRTRVLQENAEQVTYEHQWICPKCGNTAKTHREQKDKK